MYYTPMNDMDRIWVFHDDKKIIEMTKREIIETYYEGNESEEVWFIEFICRNWAWEKII